MNANQFLRYLRKHGCTLNTEKGKGGHVLMEKSGHRATIPTHGGRKELGPSLIHRICKQLGVPKL